MSQPSVAQTVGFAAGLCFVCSLFVAGSAVGLKPMQDANKLLDRRKTILTAAGLMAGADAPKDAEAINALFGERINPLLVDIAEGKVYAGGDLDAATYDQGKAAKDPATSTEAPDNKAKVLRMPKVGTIYQVLDDGGAAKQLILPIEGKGLWGTMKGFVCVEKDLQTICGIKFYEHIETPGLGGEVDNPSWMALWPGRKIYDGDAVAIKVIKGKAGDTTAAPYDVDGLSGATLTSNGVTNTLQYWLGDSGWGPYLQNLKAGSAG